jgi:hypothetical protein
MNKCVKLMIRRLRDRIPNGVFFITYYTYITSLFCHCVLFNILSCCFLFCQGTDKDSTMEEFNSNLTSELCTDNVKREVITPVCKEDVDDVDDRPTMYMLPVKLEPVDDMELSPDLGDT